MHTPVPYDLAPDALDARKLVDRAKRMGVAVGQDVAHARRAYAGDEA
jgi:hypothetical protein